MLRGCNRQGERAEIRPSRVIAETPRNEAGQLSCIPVAVAAARYGKRMLRPCASAFALAATTIAAAPAPSFAADQIGWERGDVVMRTGVAVILFDGSAKVKVNGAEVPGGSISLSDNVTAVGDMEYFLSRSVSMAVIYGIPPRTRMSGTGSLSSVGEIGRVRYGLGALVVRYHFNSGRRLSPFIGGGVNRFIVFSSKGRAVTNLKTESAWGPAMQAGVDYHINGNLGLYASVAFVPTKTDARGLANGVPATARATADPTIFQGGLSYRF